MPPQLDIRDEGVLKDDVWTDEQVAAMEAAIRLLEHKARVSNQENATDSTQPELTAVPPVEETQSAPKPASNRPLVSQALEVDIEDVGFLLDRGAQFRGSGMYVTDFSSSQWCQQQVAFSLSAALPKEVVETPAMLAGREKHALLEAETALDAVEIPTQSREDRFAVRIINMDQSLKQLLTDGMTREFPIIGCIQGQQVRGVIDQLSMSDLGLVQVVEQKTRFQPSLPGACQKQTTALQLMLYRHLFEDLLHLFSKTAVVDTLRTRRLQPYKSLSKLVQEHAVLLGFSSENLVQLCRGFLDTIEALPRTSEEMLVNYIWQGDGELIEQEVVNYDDEFLNAAVYRHLQFWTGKAAPEKTAPREQWKCDRCNFRSKCWPMHSRNVPWQHS